MKKDIILCGVGGQGILSIAAAIGAAALKNNLYLKQAETHGMSQRGGDVVSHLRLSSEPIFSDLIPLGGADLILSVEPLEALRYFPYLSPNGTIVTNNVPFKNIPNYPSEETIFAELKKWKNLVIINAEEIAESLQAKRSSNIVMLGAAVPFLGIPYDSFAAGIKEIFERKGQEIVETNLAALKAGYDFANKK
ncbi:MAG TPA: indolepyruvate oxidoreductase subunit beta [Salinivirgaceae bacterium]|nr:indolepyruvate oxidoreductase subunit beta [Salinivirgaceae bacterium]